MAYIIVLFFSFLGLFRSTPFWDKVDDKEIKASIDKLFKYGHGNPVATLKAFVDRILVNQDEWKIKHFVHEIEIMDSLVCGMGDQILCQGQKNSNDENKTYKRRMNDAISHYLSLPSDIHQLYKTKFKNEPDKINILNYRCSFVANIIYQNTIKFLQLKFGKTNPEKIEMGKKYMQMFLSRFSLAFLDNSSYCNKFNFYHQLDLSVKYKEEIPKERLQLCKDIYSEHVDWINSFKIKIDHYVKADYLTFF